MTSSSTSSRKANVESSTLKRFGRRPSPAGHRRRPPVDAELRIRGDRGLRVSGHLDLRNDRDVARGRVGDDLAHLLLRVEAAVEPRLAGRRIDVGRGSGPAGTRQAPTSVSRGYFLISRRQRLVVGQVPVQHVELVQRHRVDEALDELRRLVVARRIEHQAAPAEARRIVDLQRRNAALTSAASCHNVTAP